MALYLNLWSKIKKSYFFFKENALFFVCYMILSGTLTIISRSLILNHSLTISRSLILNYSLIISLLFSIIGSLLSLNYTNNILNIIDTKRVEVAHLFSYDKRFFEWILYSFIFYTAVFLSALCLVIPAFIVGVRFCLADFYFVDGAGPVESFKKSWQATSSLAVTEYFVYWGLSFLGFLISAFTIVGLVVFPALFILARALLYKELKNKH